VSRLTANVRFTVIAIFLVILSACGNPDEQVIIYKSSYIHSQVEERLKKESIEHKTEGRRIYFSDKRVPEISSEVSGSISQFGWDNRELSILTQKIMAKDGVGSYLEENPDGTFAIYFDSEHHSKMEQWADEAFREYMDSQKGDMAVPLP
jgi:hypothetical protein